MLDVFGKENVLPFKCVLADVIYSGPEFIAAVDRLPDKTYFVKKNLLRKK